MSGGLPNNPNESFRRRNPHLYGVQPPVRTVNQKTGRITFSEKKRIRQGEKPPTKLEADWRLHQEAFFPGVKFRAQAIRFRLANGAWYRPDLMAWMDGRMNCWETKGPKQMKNVARGILTVKFAATAWPEVRFTLVWREAGQWHEQVVLP
jgi:hypothetical protein